MGDADTLGKAGREAEDWSLPGLPGLAGVALARLPLPVGLALQRDGTAEPELVQVNAAFASLVGGGLPGRLPCPIGALAAEKRSRRQERRLRESFAAQCPVSEVLSFAGRCGPPGEITCAWTPLAGAGGDAGCCWTVTLTHTGSPTDGRANPSRDLQASEDSLAAIFEYAPLDICLKDAEGRYLQVSRRYEELYGVTNEEIRGKLPGDIGIGEAWARKVRAIDLAVLRSRRAQAFEVQIPFPQGTVEGFAVTFPLINAAGTLQGIGTICTDITERKVAERALVRSQLEAARTKALLSEAVESMTDGFVWFDSEGKLVLCNRKYRDLFPKLADALTPGAAYGDLLELALDRDQLAVLSGDEGRLTKLSVPDLLRAQPTFRTKTSEGRWIEARNHPLAAGGFIGIRFDVTERVAAEEALEESRQQFKDFAQSGPGGFWEMDEALRFSSFLDVQKNSGRSRPSAREATGRTLWEVFAADPVADPYWRSFREDLESRRPIKDLRAAYRRDGECFYWRINGRPYWDQSGRFRGYRGVAEDETAEVTARQRAEAAEERLTDAIESISEGFALYDADDRLVLCNQTYRKRAVDGGRHLRIGSTFEEIIRANLAGGCVAGLASEAEREAWLRARIAAHQAAEGSFEINWSDGRSYLMTERRTHDGGIASVSTDITELKRAREIAETANRAKTRFLAAASHDLRQPLHAIELFVAALEAGVGDPETRNIVADLREAANAAGRLLNALLDISELESGKLEARFSDFPVQQLLDRVVRLHGPQARERGLSLKMVPSSHVVRSDPDLLERIIGNLLSNAVRYTPAGGILLGCRRRGGRLRIEVWDSGPGIPEGERQRIFEEFHQLDNPARERERGLGLGLSIVRRLADILGHDISLGAGAGGGSVFAVEMDLPGGPAALVRQHGAGRFRGAIEAGTTVLVIDDDRQVRKGMVRALESWGCRVETAGDDEEAAAIVAAAPDAIDLVIADYRLPKGCSGVRLAGRLRALSGRKLPALVVTADQGEREMQEVAESGLPILQKPVDPEALQRIAAELLEDVAATADEADA